MVESVGVSVTQASGVLKSVVENCFELKKDSQYVLFISRGTDGTYGIDNHNLGRFNTDGTDWEDEFGVVGGLNPNGTKTLKQKLRDEMTAAYGVVFKVSSLPYVKVLSARIAGLAPNSSASDGNGKAETSGVGRPTLGGDTVETSVAVPQPAGGTLQVQQNATGTWADIASVAFRTSAETAAAPVGQTVTLPGGTLHPNALVRARIVNGDRSTVWSDPVTVQFGY